MFFDGSQEALVVLIRGELPEWRYDCHLDVRVSQSCWFMAVKHLWEYGGGEMMDNASFLTCPLTKSEQRPVQNPWSLWWQHFIFFFWLDFFKPVKNEPRFPVISIWADLYHFFLTVFDALSTYYETKSWPEALKTGVSLGKGYVLPDADKWLKPHLLGSAQEDSLFCDVNGLYRQEANSTLIISSRGTSINFVYRTMQHNLNLFSVGYILPHWYIAGKWLYLHPGTQMKTSWDSNKDQLELIFTSCWGLLDYFVNGSPICACSFVESGEDIKTLRDLFALHVVKCKQCIVARYSLQNTVAKVMVSLNKAPCCSCLGTQGWKGSSLAHWYHSPVTLQATTSSHLFPKLAKYLGRFCLYSCVCASREDTPGWYLLPSPIPIPQAEQAGIHHQEISEAEGKVFLWGAVAHPVLL